MLKPEIYKQLPRTSADGICPICRHKIVGTKNIRIELHDANRSASISAECRVLYCTTCAIPFANGQIITEVRKKHNGLSFDLFTANKKCSVAYIENKMRCRKDKSVRNHTECSQHEEYNIIVSSSNAGHEIVAVSPGREVGKTPQTLISSGEKMSTCPKCSSRLYRDHTVVSTSKTQKATIQGLFCPKCEYLYVKNKNAIDKILRDNQYAKGFTLDGERLWSVTQAKKFHERINRIRAIESSVVMICVSFGGKSAEEFVIVNQQEAHSPENKILHYASVEARELLSAAFSKERERKGIFGGRHFRTVARPIYPNSKHSKIPEYILPTELNIERGGGYYSSVLNNNYEIVDMLLYSPFSERYELMKATCNKNDGYCFADIGLYKKFIKEHGNPGLFLGFNYDQNSLSDWNNLKTESILKEYGYSVAQKDALPTAYRQNLLAEMVDLGILTIPKIVSLLNIFIRTHPSDKDIYARHKWAEDKRFIENYKANPSRFLIAKPD